jgi:hypothetical protein
MKHSFNRRAWLSMALLVVVVVAMFSVWGCFSPDQNPVASNDTQQDPTTLFTTQNPAVQSVMAVQDRHTPSLMADPEIIGTATTLADDQPAILVLATSQRAAAGVPRTIDGVRVVIRMTDKIVAMKGPPGGGGGVSHTAIQTPPIQLGTSGGWADDLANGYCCGGTLGALIQVGGQKRILSNYHVFEADIVSGGNGIVATTGDDIIQPGLIDVNCNKNNAQVVASLVVSHSLPGSNVDCSSATIVSGMVREDGAILEVGTLSSSTVGASVGQAVKKSGRTTGLSRSTVDALNATVSVAYENECAGGSAFTKTFNGQIIIKNRASKFLAGGDSGSLMVEDVTTNPRAVGLLFAGSSSLAVANPIGQVLSFLGASMVGN